MHAYQENTGQIPPQAYTWRVYQGELLHLTGTTVLKPLDRIEILCHSIINFILGFRKK